MKIVSSWQKLRSREDPWVSAVVAIYKIDEEGAFIKIQLHSNDDKWTTNGLYRDDIFDNENIYSFNTLEAAKAQVEKVLLNNGYKFVNHEEFERLRLLA